MTTFATINETMSAIIESHRARVLRVEARKRWGSSGLLLDAQGHLVAASHTIEVEDDIIVELEGGERREAELLGRDAGRDLALLKLGGDPPELQAPALDEQHPALGTLTIVLHRARDERGGLQASLGFLGSVSGKVQTWAGGELSQRLQIDNLPKRAASGGVALTSHGVLGLVSGALARQQDLIVAAADIATSIERLKKQGGVSRGYLGVSVYPVRLPEDAANARGQGGALMILDAQPDAPGARGGLQQGDVLLDLAGQRLEHPRQLMALLAKLPIDQSAEATLRRAGEELTLQLQPGKRSATKRSSS